MASVFEVRDEVWEAVEPLLPTVEPAATGRPSGRPTRADELIADRGYDHDSYRRALWARGVKPASPAARSSTAPASDDAAGSSSAPSPGCTSSADYASAGNANPRYTSCQRYLRAL